MKDSLPKNKLLVFTGPIDAYYASLGMPKLEYRSLRFEKEYHEPEGGYYQEALQVSLVDERDRMFIFKRSGWSTISPSSPHFYTVSPQEGVSRYGHHTVGKVDAG